MLTENEPKRPSAAEAHKVTPATLVDNKGRTWTESLETAGKTSTPIWTLEHLRLTYDQGIDAWVLEVLPNLTQYDSGKQQIKQAIDNLDHTIKTALSDVPSPQTITDREGRVWTLNPDAPGKAFWFTLVTFENRKREVRLVPEGGGRYVLGIVGHTNPRGILQEKSITDAIEESCRSYLPREKPAQPGLDPEFEEVHTLTDRDGRVWTWSQEDAEWRMGDYKIVWREKEPKSHWWLLSPNAAPTDLHESTIRPAIKYAAKYLPKPKEAPVSDMPGAPYTDTAGRTWKFDVRDSTWWTNVVYPGYESMHDVCEIRMARGEHKWWVLEGLPGGSINTGLSIVSEAIEAVREAVDSVVLTPDTANQIILDQMARATPRVSVPAVEAEHPSVTEKKAAVEAVKADPFGAMLDLSGIRKAFGVQEDAPVGAWLVVNEYAAITVYLAEIDALRAVNASEESAKAYFVPDGKTLADVRGY